MNVTSLGNNSSLYHQTQPAKQSQTQSSVENSNTCIGSSTTLGSGNTPANSSATQRACTSSTTVYPQGKTGPVKYGQHNKTIVTSANSTQNNISKQLDTNTNYQTLTAIKAYE